MMRTTIEIPSPPIACSLTAAEYRQRVADTGQVARDALLQRRPIDGGARLVFKATAGIRRKLEAFIAAESDCCPFLTMHVESHGDRLFVDVTGPELAAPIIEELFT